MSLEELRRQYTMGGLHESDMPSRPMELFAMWMQEALDNAPADWVEPYAMTLATTDGHGDVSARILLLRGYDDDGLVFYTNYESAKGSDLAACPTASLLFYWGYLERQVRVTGQVSKISREKSEAYFHKRPRGSQIGASVSRQSQVISGRDELENAVSSYESELGDAEVPLPDDWGGYVLKPNKVEFWQGRRNRLHDRLLYVMSDSDWQIQRLSP